MTTVSYCCNSQGRIYIKGPPAPIEIKMDKIVTLNFIENGFFVNMAIRYTVFWTLLPGKVYKSYMFPLDEQFKTFIKYDKNVLGFRSLVIS